MWSSQHARQLIENGINLIRQRHAFSLHVSGAMPPRLPRDDTNPAFGTCQKLCHNLSNALADCQSQTRRVARCRSFLRAVGWVTTVLSGKVLVRRAEEAFAGTWEDDEGTEAAEGGGGGGDAKVLRRVGGGGPNPKVRGSVEVGGLQ